MTEPAADRLARALRDAGLDQMADRAAAGQYGDFTSPYPTPIVTLVTELSRIGTPAALAIRQRAMNGEFDGE